jgi:zinc transport system substrate-binding protein
VLKGVSNKNLLVINTSTGIIFAEDRDLTKHHKYEKKSESQREHQHAYNGKDPHLWLDFSNAQTMVENILNGFIVKDPANRDVYLKNAEAYSAELSRLDRQFQKVRASCKKDMIIHGGHFAFGYLARRYHLQYLSAYRGFSPNAEPTPGNIIQLIKNLRNHHLNYIFFEELVSPNVSETIAREAGAKLMMLHGAHNISRDEWEQNVTFISLMENNLKNLRIGLECQ